jgi:putative transposase
VIPGEPHHVTHRGNLRADVFLTQAERELYLRIVAECAAEAAMEIWAWCAMTNHVHLLVVPAEKDSLRRGVGLAHQRYAAAVNARHGWTGHLWANRFFSTPLDAAQLWHAVKYVELNPVRAGLVERAEEYEWSSARKHAGLVSSDPLLTPGGPFPGPVGEWTQWLAEGLDEDSCAEIRRCTYTGRPCGSRQFTRRLEAQLGRPLAPQKRGPKPKSTEGVDKTKDMFGEL